ncbi:MAG: NAD(P)/FAD-dependent oxidoreductase [Lautropia sp.]
MDGSSPTSDAAELPSVAVIGAGIVGACLALRLAQRNARVALIDRDEPGNGCSFGNSGAISESSVAPLAMPGILSSVPAMLLDRKGPLYLPLAHLPVALPWLAQFVASARPARVAQAAQALAALHLGAVERHTALAREVGVPELVARRGHLHLYPDAAALAKDAGGWALREQMGFRFARLARDEILALEPRVPPRYTHGVYLEDHATVLNPHRYVKAIIDAGVARGVRIERDEVKAIEPATPSASAPARWLVHQGTCTNAFEHVIVAAGMWSRPLLAPLGLHLPLESQRGYHVQYAGAERVVSRTVVLADRKVFVTPMEGGVRVGGTVEIGGTRRAPDWRRAALLEDIATEAFPMLEPITPTRWMGHRPCTPNSVPIVGAAADRPGLWIATGHGHLGLTDSIGSAERIADAIAAQSR